MPMSDSDLNNLPCFDVASAISKIPVLQNIDIDQHLPSQINFNYYSEQDFLNCREITSLSKNDFFSTIHCNIRSLAANFDKLSFLLTELKFPFSVIGISETKINMYQECIVNSNISGYNFLSQPSLSNAGGVGLFVNNNLK
jgi:hypothetical protein